MQPSLGSALKSLAFALGVLGPCKLLVAQKLIPDLSRPVIDEERVLPARQLAVLENYLFKHRDTAQVQIWIFKSLQGEPIESLSIRAAEKWKLGDKVKDNGLLVLVAIEDRKMRIEVGQGLEGDIPDVLASRWIREILAPAFRSGDYGAGLSSLVVSVYSRLGINLADGSSEVEELDRLARSASAQIIGNSIFKFLFLCFILFVVFGRLFFMPLFFGRNRGFPGSGRGTLGSGSRNRTYGGWSGGSWGGGGGFGGWSGGGGGFSGGGSSGSW